MTELVDDEVVGIEGAHVEDSQRHYVVLTAADGSFTITDVEPHQGSIFLFVVKTGYQSVSRVLVPTANETRVEVRLERE